MLAIPSVGLAYPRPGITHLISLTSDGHQAETRDALPYPVSSGDCGLVCQSALSANGRFIAFESDATDLVDGDTNRSMDIFVRDLKKGSTERVSISNSGEEGLGACTTEDIDLNSPQYTAPAITGSYGPSISANGRFVAFASCSQNLVLQDDKHARDIFVRDRKAGTTELISAATDGTPAVCGPITQCNYLYPAAISDDGNHVTFISSAPNLVQNDTNLSTDAFVKDLRTGELEMVSVAPDGSQLASVAGGATISGNGRYVAFRAGGNQLQRDNPLDYAWDVILYDRDKGKAEIINITTDGRREQKALLYTFPQPDGAQVAISDNGRFVSFMSLWNGFVPNDHNDAWDAFVKDRTTGRFERVSVTSDGQEEAAYSVGGSFSHDGRFLSFMSDSQLAPSDLGGGTCSGQHLDRSLPSCKELDLDAYVHDRVTGSIDLISRAFDGTSEKDLDGTSHETGSVTIDATGSLVAFTTASSRMVRDDNNKLPDVFVRDRGDPVGAGPGVGLGSSKEGRAEPQPSVWVEGIRIPAQGAVDTLDESDDLHQAMTDQGANLYGASLAYRPQYGDLFAAIELEHMPAVLPGLSPVLHGLRFDVEDESYEVRASSFLGGTFGLFECTRSPTCTKVADLRGGYGTTGMRVVFSLPLVEIGLEEGGELSNVEAFSAIGSYFTGPTEVLDTVRLSSK